MLEKLFRLSANQTTIRREILGGFTTFLTMSYIIFLQPVILSSAGMDSGAVMVATCLSSAFATFVMAFLANYPIALAPGVGLNVFFAITVCIGMNLPWQTALGAVFIAGIVFIILSVFGFRKMIMDCIPPSLKFGIAVGIGLMITLLGFEWAGIVVNDDVTLVTVSGLTEKYVLISGLGLITAMILTCWNIRGAILIGMIVAAVASIAWGLTTFTGFVSAPPSLAPIFLQLDPLAALNTGMFTIVLIFLIIDLFDTVGTLVGVAELGGFTRDGELPRANQALLADAIGTVGGAMLGTSTVTSYVESCAGISDGARTGLANIVTGILFLLALVISPLVEMMGRGIQTESGAFVYPVIAPALIMVGFMMMRGVKYIQWDEPADSIPAFLTIVIIAFSFSITEGIAFGFMSYTILKTTTGRFREIHPLLLIITIVFVIRYFFIAL
ncbi:MAG: NCS2 family permease [Candidatus Omnitrophota bacterium]|nr:MAG: NCS2 family permease [Candidatus Omnitrophota bacterium]